MESSIHDIKQSSFLDLIKEKHIQIPIIQRDYAQGRNDLKTKVIRENFLSALIDVVSNDEKPINLDFIYGSTKEKDNNDCFIPLDGQQRLTTLFLLHWYLCPNDEALKAFQNNNFTSRFSYDTRISSKDFCNKLVFAPLRRDFAEKRAKIKQLLNEVDEEDKKIWRLSDVIKNEPWFMWAWKKDPTVNSMLVMLDAINEKLQHREKDELLAMWNRLIRRNISFHLLHLEKFNLTDELYVKMNARGKELSIFDIFKSTMEEQMRLNKVQDIIQNT